MSNLLSPSVLHKCNETTTCAPIRPIARNMPREWLRLLEDLFRAAVSCLHISSKPVHACGGVEFPWIQCLVLHQRIHSIFSIFQSRIKILEAL